MTLEGRIAIDVSFSDSTTSTATQSLKRITLTSTDAYSSGKVAVLSGTVGTAAVTLTLAPTTYRDSSGALVSFSSVSRFALMASGGVDFVDASTGAVVPASGNSVSVWTPGANTAEPVQLQSGGGTVSYTLVAYGT